MLRPILHYYIRNKRMLNERKKREKLVQVMSAVRIADIKLQAA